MFQSMLFTWINPLTLWLLMINCILNIDACYFLQNTIQHKLYCKVLSVFLLSIMVQTVFKKPLYLKTTTCDSLCSKNHDFKSSVLALALVLTQNFLFSYFPKWFTPWGMVDDSSTNIKYYKRKLMLVHIFQISF